MANEPGVRSELMALLRYANASEVARALGVTPQAVINWQQGRNTSPGRLAQVRALLGLDTTKEPPSGEPDRGFLERWMSPEPPPWAAGIADQIIAEVRSLRDWTAETAIQAALDRAEAAMRETLPPAPEVHGTSDQSPSTPGGLGARRKPADD